MKSVFAFIILLVLFFFGCGKNSSDDSDDRSWRYDDYNNQYYPNNQQYPNNDQNVILGPNNYYLIYCPDTGFRWSTTMVTGCRNDYKNYKIYWENSYWTYDGFMNEISFRYDSSNSNVDFYTWYSNNNFSADVSFKISSF